MPERGDPEFFYRDNAFTRISFHYGIMIRLMILMLISGLFILGFPRFDKIIELYSERLELENSGYRIIPDLEDKIKSIDSILKNITTKNIEARISRIENAIELGTVKTEELASFESLRQDVSNIKDLISSETEKVLEVRLLVQDYKALRDTLKNTMTKDEIGREIRFLTNMFYALLGVLGILLTFFGVTWFRTQRTKQS